MYTFGFELYSHRLKNQEILMLGLHFGSIQDGWLSSYFIINLIKAKNDEAIQFKDNTIKSLMTSNDNAIKFKDETIKLLE